MGKWKRPVWKSYKLPDSCYMTWESRSYNESKRSLFARDLEGGTGDFYETILYEIAMVGACH